jgi:GNAT superfamily N-acetyltransferase
MSTEMSAETQTRLEIVEVDPFDVAAVTTWVEVTNAVDRHERGEHATPHALPDWLTTLQEEQKHRKRIILSGSVDGTVVATGRLHLPLLDNLTAADVEVNVLPEHRRRGYGSLMLERLEAIARENGRTRFDAMTAWPYDGAADGTGTSGVEFAKTHGYTFGLGDVQREAVLPIDDTALAELAAEAAPYAEGYELRSWAGPFPDDDLLLSYLELSSTLMNEAPTGDNEYEDEAVDVEAHRIMESVMAKQNRTMFTTVALTPDGKVVAFTDLMVPGNDPTSVFQWGTIVDRAHRGHRLGLAVKAANLRALQATGDYTGRRLITWNAEINEHMIGINERMGFVPTARAGELQKKVPS